MDLFSTTAVAVDGAEDDAVVVVVYEDEDEVATVVVGLLLGTLGITAAVAAEAGR